MSKILKKMYELHYLKYALFGLLGVLIIYELLLLFPATPNTEIQISGSEFLNAAVPYTKKSTLETVVGLSCLKWSDEFCHEETRISDLCQEFMNATNGEKGIIGFDYNKDLFSEPQLIESLDENQVYKDLNKGILVVFDVSCPQVCSGGFLVRCLNWSIDGKQRALDEIREKNR